MSTEQTIIGIDLGTTNSEVAVVLDGQAIVIADDKGNKVLPSVVGINENAELMVGDVALNQSVLYPERTVRSIKRSMGKDEQVVLGDKSYTPQEISAIILKTLKNRADEFLKTTVNKAVITVPAYFNDAQRQATREAGEIAGLEVVRIINEPTAAALAYESDLQQARKILVYDLGGGTFDVSIVDIQSGVVEVVASHGDNHLGGDDFDEKIVQYFIDIIRDDHALDVNTLSDVNKVLSRLRHAAIAAKISLSDLPYTTINEEFLTEKDGVPVHFSHELSRASYEEMIEEFIDKTFESVHIALSSAKLTVSDLDEVLLVGGSTRTPLVINRLQQELGITPQATVDPDLCVATGAAIQAAVISGEKIDAVLVDITPYTFGLSAFGEMNGMPYPFVFVPLIHRNAVLPVSKSEVFFTMHEEQKAAEISVHQGENTDAQLNTMIGEFKIDLDKVREENPIVVSFDLNLDGILKVTATEKNTGLEKSIRIENAVSRMDDDDMTEARDRVDSLFGDDKTTTKASDTSTPENAKFEQAQVLIEKANKMMEQATNDDKEDIIDQIEQIRAAIDNNNEDAISKPMENLTDILYYLES
jgi:molecular chaperone DnaK (HSP70)